MKFKVYKFSLNGICGGASEFSLKEVEQEIYDHRGWHTLNELRQAIHEWGRKATPGSAYATCSSVIVCVPAHNGARFQCPKCFTETNIDVGELTVDSEDDVVQDCKCRDCNCRWEDRFVLAERSILG